MLRWEVVGEEREEGRKLQCCPEYSIAEEKCRRGSARGKEENKAEKSGQSVYSSKQEAPKRGQLPNGQCPPQNRLDLQGSLCS